MFILDKERPEGLMAIISPWGRGTIFFSDKHPSSLNNTPLMLRKATLIKLRGSVTQRRKTQRRGLRKSISEVEKEVKE